MQTSKSGGESEYKNMKRVSRGNRPCDTNRLQQFGQLEWTCAASKTDTKLSECSPTQYDTI